MFINIYFVFSKNGLETLNKKLDELSFDLEIENIDFRKPQVSPFAEHGILCSLQDADGHEEVPVGREEARRSSVYLQEV